MLIRVIFDNQLATPLLKKRKKPSFPQGFIEGGKRQLVVSPENSREFVCVFSECVCVYAGCLGSEQPLLHFKIYFFGSDVVFSFLFVFVFLTGSMRPMIF